MDNKLKTRASHCPKCGKLFDLRVAEDPIHCLVILHLHCRDCGTSDTFALSDREFFDRLFGGDS